MTGSLNKSFNYTIIIDSYHLKSIVETVKIFFDDISYEIKTVDGACYKLDTVDDVISYSNPSPRKIKKIVISANNKSNTSRYFPDFSVSLFDSSLYDASCILSLNNMSEQEISFWSQRIEELVKSSRASYWWIHKPVVYWVLGTFLYLAFIVWYYSKMGKDGLTNGLSSLSLMTISIICFYISWRFIKKGIEYLFPEGGFALGEQIRLLQKREKQRNIILISFLGSLVIGVISGILVHYLMK